jgi:2,4-dienoyl-CoA reductase-like NADH-dependent reductase (Old Yellow Enzyme family)
MAFPRIARFRNAAALRAHLATIDTPIPLDDAPLSAAAGSPLAAPITIGGRTVGNRFCIHPMEGWDATTDGRPTEPLLRRWRHFGISGAKLVWGGEAVAVVPEGRANPNQLAAPACGADGLGLLLDTVRAAHAAAHGTAADLLVALQFTHSGRFCRPGPGPRRPVIAFHHPLLDARHGVDPDLPVIDDDAVERLIDSYVAAARTAAGVGFEMVDVKACHGYLVHEFLAARRRAGRFGGDLAGRSRFLVELVGRIRAACPGLLVGVRLSLFDTVPWQRVGDHGEPCPTDGTPYDCGFGVDASDPTRIDLAEPIALVRILHDAGVAAVNCSAGNPYATPHLLRPAAFPPSDGYPPPEDPLVGVWRQIEAAGRVKAAVPAMTLVGSGYTYLQEYLPHAAQAVVRGGLIDLVGLGRMVLSCPELPADVLAGRTADRGRICRTFSDCTTAPRNGLRSGCYPLDRFYKTLEPDHAALVAVKAAAEG